MGNILLINFSSAEEVLLSTPLLKILREVYPEAHLFYLVEDKKRGLVRGNPYLDQVIGVSKSKFNRVKKERNIFAALRSLKPVVRQVKSRKYDLLLDLENNWQSNWFAYRASVKQRVTRGTSLKSIFYSDRVETDGSLHMVDEYLELLKPAGINPDDYDKEFRLETSRQDKDYIDRLLKKYNITTHDTVIAFNPGENKAGIAWPRRKFIEVGNWIVNELGGKVVITGNSKQERKNNQIATKIKGRVLNVTGKLNCKETAEILSRADLLLTGVSTLMQVAMAKNTPLLVLFDNSDRERFRPYQGHNLVLRSPEGEIDQISVEAVIGNLTTVLNWD